MQQLKQMFESLSRHRVKYLICGGMAVNLHGIPRMTADLDVLLEWTPDNLLNFETAIAEHGYKSNLFFQLKSLLQEEVRLQYVREKNLLAYGYSSDLFKAMTLDVLIDSPISFADCWQRKEVKHLGNVEVLVLGVDDLIVLKETADREQDRLDVAHLKTFYRK